MDFKKIIEKYFKNTKTFIYYMVIVVLFGVLLLLIGNVTSNMNTAENAGKKKNAVQVSTNAGSIGAASSYEDKLRKDIVDALGKIQGVGKVEVIINFDEDIEEIPAKNINNTQERIEEKDSQGGNRVTTRQSNNETVVTVNKGSGSEVVIIRKINPKVAGVLVVAEGAENGVLRKELLQAVRTVLNVPEHKVTIHSMKKN
jgi:stage III sporulation protein AG